MFAELLDRFLAQVPRWCDYAVEIRERSLLTDAYRDVLLRHRVAHVCSYWSGMPSPANRPALMRVEDGPFTMVRLLLPPGTRYEERRQEMAPFNRIARADERMRREVTAILQNGTRSGPPGVPARQQQGGGIGAADHRGDCQAPRVRR